MTAPAKPSTDNAPLDDAPPTSPEVTRLDRLRRGMRTFLIVWRTAVVFVVLIPISGILGIPFTTPFVQWGSAFQAQFAGLLADLHDYPVPILATVLVIIAISLISEVRYRQ